MKLSPHTPHLDNDWVEEFVVELRAHDVPGTTIGAHLAELDVHCAESGEDVRSAFGEPRAYARAIAEAAGTPPETTSGPFAAATSALLGLVALVVTPQAVGAVRHGSALDVSWGALITWVFLLVAVVLVVRFARRLLPWVARHWLWACLIAVVLIPLQVGVLLVADAPAFAVPAGPALAAGCAVLVAGLVWDLRHPVPEDAIRGPVELGRVGTVPAGRGWRAVAAMTPYLFIVLTALLVAMTWVLGG